MRHGAGHRKAAGDCGPCDRHVRSGAESPQDSARPFENAHLSSGDSGPEQKLGTCSVDIRLKQKIKVEKPEGVIGEPIPFEAVYPTIPKDIIEQVKHDPWKYLEAHPEHKAVPLNQL